MNTSFAFGLSNARVRASLLLLSALLAPLFVQTALAQAAAEYSLPEGDMTRAAFVAFMVHETHTRKSLDSCLSKLSPSNYRLLFTDVSRDHEYAKELCVAMREGMIRGYRDGSFRPDTLITFAEASKILVRGYDIFPASWYPVSEPWYFGYVTSMEYRGAIPPSIDGLQDTINDDEALEMSLRLSMNVATEPSIGYQEILRRTNAKPVQQTFSR